MLAESRLDLKLSDRLDILYHVFRGEKISPLIDKLDNLAVTGFQKFVWEKTVEFGIVCRGKNFDRKEVTRNMTPTPIFQRQQRCSKRVYNCKGTQCLHTNPDCARKKIKEHVDVMAASIREYIRIVKQKKLF
jgi:hypothetical protein